MLRRRQAQDVTSATRVAVDADTLAAAARIVEDVRLRGESALREHAERLGDVVAGGPLIIEKPALDATLRTVSGETSALLGRVADRIRRFARAQRGGLRAVHLPIAGGEARSEVASVERAGCYAPGGRYPLPSSVLMTAVTARAAGVNTVWVASPRPADVTLAAAAVAGADAVLAVGGAQAIAAMAFGAGPVPAVDVIVGPGNRWVTAAKQLVSGQVGIDMLAGPSELVVVADVAADPELIAADLLAQAEHDDDALPILVVIGSHALADEVDVALAVQLADLPTAETALRALKNGFTVVVSSVLEAGQLVDRLAPEHLELMLEDADGAARHFRHWGGMFVGAGAAEVLGDYGAGPNHVLPTGTTARFTGGLSVHNFLRIRTSLRVTDPEAAAELAADAEALARCEGLEAHARSAGRRRSSIQ
jgi:histidinol dehydrogenase